MGILEKLGTLKDMRRLIVAICFLGMGLATASLANAAEPVTLKGYAQSKHTEIPAQGIAIQGHGVVGLDLDIFPQASPKIRGVLPGTPAQKARLQSGDRILAINGADTHGLSRQAVDIAISDVPGDRVKLVISRAGQVFSVVLVVADANALASDATRAFFNDAPSW